MKIDDRVCVSTLEGCPELSRCMVRRRRLLALLIALTAFAPILFVDLREPTFPLFASKLLAKAGSLCGTILLLWQLALGFRGVLGRLVPDVLWQIDLHKRIGKWGFVLILCHPLFISLYYLIKHGSNIWLLEMPAGGQAFLALGMLALALLLLVVVTSVWFRPQLGPRRWYHLHLTSYLVLPLVFIHSYPIGMTLGTTALRNVWPVLGAVFVLLVLWRLLFPFWSGAHTYTVDQVCTVAPGIVEVVLRPAGPAIVPRLGQFVYYRCGRWRPVRPYTVSWYDPADGRIAVAIKAQSDTSRERQEVEPGEEVLIDGPYGIFTWDAVATGRPLVMLAGGIGITSFLRLVDALGHENTRPVWLFYGNLTEGGIAFRERLENVPHLHLVHVLSEAPEFAGEKGFITRELLERFLPEPLPRYEFLLCGPPVMIQKLEGALSKAGVGAAQIHHELFGY